MTRRRVLFVLLLVAVLAGGIPAYQYATKTEPAPPPGPTKANFDRLQVNDPRSRFEEVLGTPSRSRWYQQFGFSEVWWKGPGGWVIAFFDGQDRCVSAFIIAEDVRYDLEPPPPTLLGRIKAWLNL